MAKNLLRLKNALITPVKLPSFFRRLLLAAWWILSVGVLYLAVCKPGEPCDSEVFVISLMFWLAFPSSLVTVCVLAFFEPRFPAMFCNTFMTCLIWFCFIVGACAQYVVAGIIRKRVVGADIRDKTS